MSHSPWNIAVVGIGGVGGLLSGALVRHYGDHISLVARGDRVRHLRQAGLTVHSEVYGEFTVHPATVAETPAELAVQDLILVCVKNGALPSVARQILPMVGPETVVLPVMNGVTAADVLRGTLPVGTVLGSVIYTVSGAGADYSITQQGKFTTLYVGGAPGDEAQAALAAQVADTLSAAGIDCQTAQDVRSDIWSKYVLNCAFNVATARWGCPIGGIKADPERMEDCCCLLTEAWSLGRAAGVPLPEDLVERHLRRIIKTSDESDSSLGRDFAARRSGEMEIFSGDVVRMAEQLGVDAPVSRRYYAALADIAKGF